ncbi:MAG: 3-deoxy-D-manno-octulosonic acid transferase [Opitutaceae bacterium]
MIWFYRLLFLPGLLVVLPFYMYRMWRRGGYKKSFQHRFGRFNRLPAPAAGTTRIWLQAVSVGEVLAIGPLINALTEQPNIEIVLTTTTSTGYAEARKRYSEKALSIGIFPVDFWLFSRAAWKRIQPTALILTESELWPEHLHQAKRRKVPAFLVNARISDRSFSRYQKVPKLAARMLCKFESIFAASPLDQERLTALGADPKNVQSHGSIKFDVNIPETIDSKQRSALRQSLGFGLLRPDDGEFVLLGSSTWPGEEAVLIEAQRELIKNNIDCHLLIVPRHAERAPEVIKLLNAQDLPWHQRSKCKTVIGEIRIHLADTTGELTHLSQAADLAFIGKSLPPHHQGQTPIEAAGLGIPSLMGHKMSNFKDVSNSLVRAGAAQKVDTAEELIASILSLSKDPEKLSEMSEAGRNWHAQNRGSSLRIANQIRAKLDA